MSIIQVAADAAKSSSTIFLDGAAILALIAAGGLTTREYIKSRRSRQNGNDKGPGQAKVCIERGEAMARMDERQKNFEGDIGEIKSDVKTLLQRIPPRGE